ncbi:MAG: hypothetical protein PVJ75_09235, partial [Chloroflexota bacterium]
MIEITTFGGFQLTVDGREISLTNRKAQALLIYLASHSDQQHERAILADLFWPELPEASGLNNLSKALGQLRKAFKKAEKATEPFELTR